MAKKNILVDAYDTALKAAGETLQSVKTKARSLVRVKKEDAEEIMGYGADEKAMAEGFEDAADKKFKEEREAREKSSAKSK